MTTRKVVSYNRLRAKMAGELADKLATDFLWSDTIKGYEYWEEVRVQLLHEAHRLDDQADELSAELEEDTLTVERPAAIFEIKVNRWTPTSRWAK